MFRTSATGMVSPRIDCASDSSSSCSSSGGTMNVPSPSGASTVTTVPSGKAMPSMMILPLTTVPVASFMAVPLGGRKFTARGTAGAFVAAERWSSATARSGRIEQPVGRHYPKCATDLRDEDPCASRHVRACEGQFPRRRERRKRSLASPIGTLFDESRIDA